VIFSSKQIEERCTKYYWSCLPKHTVDWFLYSRSGCKT